MAVTGKASAQWRVWQNERGRQRVDTAEIELGLGVEREAVEEGVAAEGEALP